ncbi:hypothetical protein [Phycicoccus duodecadis]|uniref:Uncharacterized protein n=1 Tax=Phycicoccus duodecadis TaxID=173053 RepID=A0A2N3YIG0_9MICO|nr:hypothetical protein [Phycicoccus duodecadis]PKW26608.1 hypothetical protein ATL31_1422 [Phycicoccus duodecadis]
MTRWKPAALVLALVVLFGAGWVVATTTHGEGASAAPVAPRTARTALPGLVPAASADPGLISLASLHPAPGTVARAPGPFDDRFRLDGARLDGRSVRGTVTVTSDVSDLLELEVVAGFYDAEGRLLGTGRFVEHHEEGAGDEPHAAGGRPSEARAVSIPVPADLQGREVSAALGVTVLVNE